LGPVVFVEIPNFLEKEIRLVLLHSDIGLVEEFASDGPVRIALEPNPHVRALLPIPDNYIDEPAAHASESRREPVIIQGSDS
jgi:hypothetical protein